MLESVVDMIYPKKQRDTTMFAELPGLFATVQQFDPELYEKLFTSVLPTAQEFARTFPTHFPETIPFLGRGGGKVRRMENL